MTIKAIIVDDDFKSRELIHDFCKIYSNDKITIVDLCRSVDEAIISIANNKPNLVFLDIDMPQKNGFELIRHYNVVPFEIVFVTGHANEYIEAIKCSALDYLMKPINPLNIKSIIDRFEHKTEISSNQNRFDVLKNNLVNTKKSIILPNNDGFKVIVINEIIYCETSNGNGKCTSETIVVSKSLKEIFQLLADSSFLKVSSSAVINKKFVKSFHTKIKKLTLLNDYSITVTEYNKSSLMDAISK
ncbi:LytTR family DNA-binding domain-containing protein [Flavobacterium sp.]|uniref:LytR/AlgR family response regulator transcription factor n=1 Tax=Flavobacterium sp. TaxID=239 RepID=UPI002627D309|nr:LytTR family DNA-binding domain-containing protein [Flavobacterium sp.]MDG2433169.1 LytTR family DNA-binding domain-containing protein [Flavobacterium sp.]